MATATLTASSNASILADQPTLNLVEVQVGERNDNNNNFRALITFSTLSDGTIPTTAVVTSSVLRLYMKVDKSSNARTLSVYRLKRAWVQSQVTWNIFSTGNNWQTAGCAGANDREATTIGTAAMSAAEIIPSWKEVTLDNALTQEMINGTFTNNGLFLQNGVENNDSYEFGEISDGATAPQLVVNYTMVSSVNGLAKASIASINGLATASIASINNLV